MTVEKAGVISRLGDGDTRGVTVSQADGTKYEKIRAAGIDTDESESSTGDKVSESGIQQKHAANRLVSEGDVISVEEHERDAFGRVVGTMYKEFGGTKVNMEFLQASLGIGIGTNRYGKQAHHDLMKTTNSAFHPYQYSEKVPPMTVEEFQETQAKYDELDKLIWKENLTADETADRDKLIADLYSEEAAPKTANFLDMKKLAMLEVNWDEQPMSGEKLIYQTLKDPDVQKAIDKASQQTQGRRAFVQKQREPSFRAKISAAFDMLNDVPNITRGAETAQMKFEQKAHEVINAVAEKLDMQELYDVDHKDLVERKDEIALLIADVPAAFHAKILDGIGKYGYEHGAAEARNLRQNIKTGEIFNDMNLMEQLGYGAIATIASPSSLIGGGAIIKGASVTGKVIRGWEIHSALKTSALATNWIASTGAASLVSNSPRLIGDSTYSAGDMMFDSLLDTSIGLGLLGGGMLGKKLVQPFIEPYIKSMQASRAAAASRLKQDLDTKHELKKQEVDREKQLYASADQLYEQKKKERPHYWEEQQRIEYPTKDEGQVPYKVGDVYEGEPVNYLDPVTGEPVEPGMVDAEASMGWWDDAPDIGDDLVEKQVQKEIAEAAEDAVLTPAEQLSQDNVASVVEANIATGADKEFTDALDGGSLLTKVATGLGEITGRAQTRVMQLSDNKYFRFVGQKFLEDPMGTGGRRKRGDTAAMMRQREVSRSLSQLTEPYTQAIDKWVMARGYNKYQAGKAAWAEGSSDKFVREFDDAVVSHINDLKMGRKNEVDPVVKDFVKQWDKYMAYNFNNAKEQGLPGFKKARKNYFPQLHDQVAVRNKINEWAVTDGANAAKNMETLYLNAMISAKDKGLHTADLDAMRDIASKLVKQAQDVTQAQDSKAAVLGRTNTRIEMDWATTYKGVKLSDVLQTGVLKTGGKYSNDLAGRLAIHSNSAGRIVSDLDIATLRKLAIKEHADAVDGMDKAARASADKKFKKELGIFNDQMEMLLGRPSRGGLPEELRHLKNVTMLTRMGTLGTAQSIETGNIMARSVMDMFSDRGTLKALFKKSGNTLDDEAVMNQIMDVTGRTKGMEYLFRIEELVSREEMKQRSKARQLSLWAADKATFGSMKAPAARVLSKVSGFNAVQKHQSYIAQRTFLHHVDAYFRKGKSAISTDRLIDLGVLDTDGTNKALKHVFNNVVKRDKHGYITDLRWDKWSKKAQKEFQVSAQRDEAQRIQQTFAGETPAYHNNPLMNLLLQFREVPLVAMNKQMARNLAFADKEAMLSTMLNFATASIVRFAWLSGLGYAKYKMDDEDSSFNLPDIDRLDQQRYMASGGLFPDAVEMGMSAWRAYDKNDPKELIRQVPASGPLFDAIDFISGTNKNNERVEALQGLVPCGNTWAGDIIHTGLVSAVHKLKKADMNIPEKTEEENANYRF